MKVVGSFNKVTDELKKELIKPLGKELVFFQLLNGSYDPTIGREVFGSSRSIRLTDRIYDPHIKNEKGEVVGGYVDIGVPEVIKEGRVERCKKYWIEAIANGMPGNGSFSFNPTKVDDVEVYEFLCLSNGNKNNPHRDTSKAPEYEIIDVNAIRLKDQEKDFKELQAKLARFSKDNPAKAAELGKYIPVREAKPEEKVPA